MTYSAGATLQGAFSGVSGSIAYTGFLLGSSANNLTEREDLKCSSTEAKSGIFTQVVSGLSSNTTYYYRAYVKENGEMRLGDIKSFTTASSTSVLSSGWMELPSSAAGSDSYTGSFSANGKRNYSYMYQFSTYTSLWTAYPLYSSAFGGKASSWQANPNPNIPESQQVNCWDNSYSVKYGETEWSSDAASSTEYYARGHNIPNGDRDAISAMQTQTYYATNSTPQIQNKFNASIWSTLEGDIRDIASATDTVYVVTGAAFNKVGETKEVTYIHPRGDSDKDVPVPNYYWKVILKVKWSGSGSSKTVSSAKAIGVWLTHEPKSSSDYSSGVVSVDKIETWTGFDFFVNLPGDNNSGFEASAEANTSWTIFVNF